ncbi:uncharacterized protein BKA55DRAFT_594575 [Fusarium redolens]|uniref:DUF6604 domain-containing protein n=1 Tax=Fusarium redolens TaxID=48865 RepID=A0A9P9K5H1_FUSRE|nr:uncharacterized protein BKA55DRAFT_594575 [Fusarium redolens]KAH7248683.1 hypothetical protein BKA55DRAFT_594575 [Fusarium redolens]
MLSPAYMTTWLANTAKAHGYDADAAVGAAALEALKKKKKKRKGNGKGKGPVRAKNKKTTEKQDPSTKKYVIRVRDFEAIAKHVAETNAVEVPHQTAVALERGIWGMLKVSRYVDFSDTDAFHSSQIILSETRRERCKKGSSLWETYANGELDLAAVALATNTAFEFAQSMEMDIKKLIDKFGGAVEDDLVRGMGAALKEKSEHPRLWMLWVLQMYLDIVHGLGESESLKIQKALVDLPRTAERREVLQAATRWNHDSIFETNQSMMEFGVMVQSDDETGRIPKGQAWEDLEELWGYQGNSCFFVGNPPKDLESYYRNYYLCLGTSVINWAPNRRSVKATEHKGNAPNMKLDGWLSLSLDNRIRMDNPREPWTTATVGALLTEGRKKATLDGKGHIQKGLKQKAKEANPKAVPKSPSGLIDQLAHVLNSEILRISFNYFTMHNIAWSFLTDLKRALTTEVGPEFLKYIPSGDQLPFVVGYVFSTASGHGSSDVRERQMGNDRFVNVATEVMSEFLNEGKGKIEGYELRKRWMCLFIYDKPATGMISRAMMNEQVGVETDLPLAKYASE